MAGVGDKEGEHGFGLMTDDGGPIQAEGDLGRPDPGVL